MRLRLTVLVSAAVFLVRSSPAAASDAGDVASSEGGATDASAASVDAAAADADASVAADLEVEDSGEEAEAVPVIACDGALCDTTQGRPTCAVASRSVGHSAVDPGAVALMVAGLAAGLLRRSRRGT